MLLLKSDISTYINTCVISFMDDKLRKIKVSADYGHLIQFSCNWNMYRFTRILEYAELVNKNK